MGSPDRWSSVPAGRSSVFAVRYDAEPEHGRALRAGLDRWLAGVEWPQDERADVVLALSEAFDNAVSHAHPPGSDGVVEVVGHVEVRGSARRAVVCVRDHGRWRPVPADRGYRGHGLTVMRECTEQLRIDHTALGTTVKLVSCGVALPERRAASRRQAPLRRGRAARTVVVSAVDRATGERRHHRAAVVRRTERLRADAELLHRQAALVWQGVQHTMRASARLRSTSERLQRTAAGEAARRPERDRPRRRAG